METGPRTLSWRHTANCRVSPERHAMLESLPQGGIGAEIGIEHCLFTKVMLEKVRPKRLHLVDSIPSYIEQAGKIFKPEIAAGSIVTHLGDSREVGSHFPDAYFDWVYVDGDHKFEYVSVDLEHARRTVKEDGLIIVNDYIMHNHLKDEPYGVVHAVNAMCHDHGYEIIHLALHPNMFCDVVLRKML